ncbi:MAG: hypothetical protein P8N72_05875 [Flavimaricola sp.]|nr:hypothetical protein [Flavimaricola sp.]
MRELSEPMPLPLVLSRLADHLGHLEVVGKRLETAILHALSERPVDRNTLTDLQGADLLVQSLDGLGQVLKHVSSKADPNAVVDMSDQLANLQLRDLALAISNPSYASPYSKTEGEVELF